MTSVDSTNPTQGDAFTKDFEEYRRACRARFEEQKSAFDHTEVDLESSDEEMEEEVETTPEVQAIPPIPSSPPTASIAQCNTTVRSAIADNSPVGAVKKASSNERRGSFSKLMSYCSNIHLQNIHILVLLDFCNVCSNQAHPKAHKTKRNQRLPAKYPLNDVCALYCNILDALSQ